MTELWTAILLGVVNVGQLLLLGYVQRNLNQIKGTTESNRNISSSIRRDLDHNGT